MIQKYRKNIHTIKYIDSEKDLSKQTISRLIANSSRKCIKLIFVEHKFYFVFVVNLLLQFYFVSVIFL